MKYFLIMMMAFCCQLAFGQAVTKSKVESMVLSPRSQSARAGVTNAELGMLMFQSDNDKGLYIFDGTAWVKAGSQWVKGASTNISYSGNVGIGVSSPVSKLQVNGSIGFGVNGTTDLQTVLDAKASQAIVNQKANIASPTFTGVATLPVTTIEGLTVGTGNVVGASTGATNTVMGKFSSGANTTGHSSAIMGYEAYLNNTTGSNNVAIGRNAMKNNTEGFHNVSVGTSALNDNNGNANTGIGQQAMSNNTTGTNNTAIGSFAGLGITTGSHNVVVGTSYTAVSSFVKLGITTGSYNTILGANVSGLAPGTSNNIILADGQGNRRINVDATGNVGIGTNTPTAKLDVVGTSNLNGSVLVGGTARFNNNMYQFWIDKDGASQKMLGMDVNGNFNIGDSQNYMGYGNNQYVTNSNHIFSTNSTEKVRINKDGNVGIGTNNPTAKLEVNGDIKFNGGKSLVSTIANLKYTKTFNKPINYFADSIVVVQTEHQVVSPEMVLMKSTTGVLMLPYKINPTTKRVVVYFNKDKAYEGSFTIF